MRTLQGRLAFAERAWDKQLFRPWLLAGVLVPAWERPGLRVRPLEGARQVFDVRLWRTREHAHNIKPDWYVPKLRCREPLHGKLPQSPGLNVVYGLDGQTVLCGLSGLNFAENDGFGVAGDDVEFAIPAPPIAVEDRITLATEILGRDLLSVGT